MVRTVVKGAARLRRKLKRMPDEIKAEVAAVIRDDAEIVLQEMRNRAPVSPWWKTREQGHIRDALSLKITLGGLRARVGLLGKTAKGLFFYGGFLEFGTRKMDKQPFILPAWMSHRDRVRENVKRATGAALQKIANWTPSDE